VQSAAAAQQRIAAGDRFTRRPFDGLQMVRWAVDVARGLQCLHDRGYVHRDVKPGNILLFPGDDGLLAKVADLGTARKDLSADASPERERQLREDRARVEELEREQQQSGEKDADPEVGIVAAPIHRFGKYDPSTAMTNAVGTPLYIAPELMGGHNYSKQVDVWSYGVMLVEMFSLACPYPDTYQGWQIMKQVAMKQLRPHKLRREDLPHPGLLDVIEGCIMFRPDTRLTIAQVESKLGIILEEMLAAAAGEPSP